MKKNVYIIWVETRLGHIDDDEEDMETEVELYEIVDCLETAQKEISRLNKNNLDHWNVEFWYSEEPLIRDTSRVNKEIYLTTPENYDYIMTLIENNKKLGKEIERLNNVINKYDIFLKHELSFEGHSIEWIENKLQELKGGVKEWT